MRPRETIVRFGELFSRVRVLLGPDYVERAELDGSELSRRRVFFAEVRLLTLHQERRWALLVIGAVIGLSFVAGALAAPDLGVAGRWAIAACGLFAVALAATAAALPRHVVTVQGGSARLRAAFPTATPARAFYDRLADLAAAAQARPAAAPEDAMPDELLPPAPR